MRWSITIHRRINMASENDEQMEEPHVPGEIELYGDPGIATYDAKIPFFLILTYIILPLWGLAVGYYYWNGSRGWLDRGYWHQLQIASNTTLPYENHSISTDPT